MTNPIDDIEQRQAMMDLGKTGYLVFKGAMEEGATHLEAITVVTAFFTGTAQASQSDDDTDSSRN